MRMVGEMMCEVLERAVAVEAVAERELESGLPSTSALAYSITNQLVARLEENGCCRPCIVSASSCVDRTQNQRHIKCRIGTSNHSPSRHDKV